MTQNVIKTLEHAKKEHELLELYQKRFWFLNFEIKLKEKELEELK